jgi:hypothetical protein
MVRRGPGQRPVVGEHEALAVEAALVGDVVTGVGRDAGEPPRVLPHQLGVGVDGQLRGPRPPGVGDRETEQHTAAPIGRQVRALESQARGVGQIVARVAPPARELRRRSDPLAVEPEPHPVDELQRRRPHPAHLAGDVPAVGVEPPVFEPDRVGPRPGRGLATILQSAARGQLRRPGHRARGGRGRSSRRRGGLQRLGRGGRRGSCGPCDGDDRGQEQEPPHGATSPSRIQRAEIPTAHNRTPQTTRSLSNPQILPRTHILPRTWGAGL